MKHPRCSKLLAFATLAWAIALVSPPLLASCKGQGACRGDERIIVYDFKTYQVYQDGCETCAADAPLRPEEPVVFKIKGINPFRHAVNVKINQVTFDALLKPPSLISGQLVPQEKAAASAKAANEKANAEERKATRKAAEPQDELWETLSSFSDAADELALFDNFAAQLRLWALLRENVQSLKDSSQGSADSLCQEIDRIEGGSAEECDPSPEGLLSVYARINSDVERKYRDMVEAHAKLQSQGLPPDQTKAIEDAYSVEEKRHQSIVDNKTKIDQQFNRAIGLFAKIFEPDFGDLYFGPVAATGDQVEIVVDTSLSPDAANLKLTATADAGSDGDVKQKSAAVSTDPLLVIPVLGRHRPSFSTGIFFTGLVDKKAQDNQNDRFSTALGAMVHTPAFYYCRQPDLSLHLSLGVALKDNNPIYVLGPSLIVGRQQRTVFTVGLAGGQVSRASGSSGTTTGSGSGTTGSQTTPPKVFRTSFFFGISFNFGATTASDSTSTNAKK